MVRSNRGSCSDRRGWLASTKTKCGKNSDVPKQPPSAFFLFLQDFRLEYKLEHPNVKVSSVINKAGGDRWRVMSDQDKASYCAMAEHRRAEYTKAMEAYNNPGEPSQHEVAHEVEPADVMYNQGEVGLHEVEHDDAGAIDDHEVEHADVMSYGANLKPWNTGDDPAPADSLVTSITGSGQGMSSSRLRALGFPACMQPSKHAQQAWGHGAMLSCLMILGFALCAGLYLSWR
ncbi:HMG1/2-like protein [Triticum dicoccoides]|uniref:HMG1/2-like protein n=1 Tax=Triticum dicoccoides TaxID=85692 RepID=UPI000E7CA7FB|nr:HMG1/2-like protein [Triticum dicoccoides]XP_037415910.1 HMG1/2-like protein [Triticum dicoccoides]